MRRAFLLVACAVLVTAQETRSGEEETPAQKREKRIASLFEEIESLAATEPPQLAIESLIRAGKEIRPHSKEKAVSCLRNAKERLAAFHSEAAKASFSSLLGQYWSELDPEEAEEICKSIPRGNAQEFESDPKSACWATRIGRESKPALRAEASLRALADGAYSTVQHATTLTQLQKADPEAAAAFFSAYLAGFPEKSAGLPELKGLVHLLRAAGADQAAISRQALELAVRCIERNEFPEPKAPRQFEARIDGQTIKTTGARDSLAFQLADLAWVVAPDLLESHADTLGKWKQNVSSGDWQRRRVTRFREVEPGIDASIVKLFGVEGIDPAALDVKDWAAARGLLNSLTDPQARLLVLTQLVAEKGLPEAQRPELLREIKETLAKVPLRSRLRMFTLFFLIDDALTREELQTAFDYGKQLVAAFDATVACADAKCEEAASEMDGGEMAADFVSYLKRREMEPIALGMSHPTLTLRRRVLELNQLVEEAQPGKGRKKMEFQQ